MQVVGLVLVFVQQFTEPDAGALGAAARGGFAEPENRRGVGHGESVPQDELNSTSAGSAGNPSDRRDATMTVFDDPQFELLKLPRSAGLSTGLSTVCRMFVRVMLL